MDEVKRLGFRAGSIIRVRVKNFLTYDECEVFPGARLNIVIGPNGTGKSALTHAICLACGGNPGTIGRSKDMTTFVRNGTAKGDETFVEVDLVKNGLRNSIRIRRTINSENKGSKWTIDGKAESFDSVKKEIKALSIDVNNLCSFMPQDKVGNFSRFNAKEVLKNTLMAIVPADGEKNLYDEQQSITSIEKDKMELMRIKSVKVRAYDALAVDIGAMASEVERMQRRNAIKKELTQYEVKAKKIQLDEINKQVRFFCGFRCLYCSLCFAVRFPFASCFCLLSVCSLFTFCLLSVCC